MIYFLSPLSPQLKELLCERMDAPVPQQCLIFAGKILKEEETLEKQGIKDGVTIHLVVRSSSSTNKVCIMSLYSKCRSCQCVEVLSVLCANIVRMSDLHCVTSLLTLYYVISPGDLLFMSSVQEVIACAHTHTQAPSGSGGDSSQAAPAATTGTTTTTTSAAPPPQSTAGPGPSPLGMFGAPQGDLQQQMAQVQQV